MDQKGVLPEDRETGDSIREVSNSALYNHYRLDRFGRLLVNKSGFVHCLKEQIIVGFA
jgi:hypothetical protein